METENFDILAAAGFYAGLTPEPILTVSEWSDAYRMLSNIASAEPGPWRTEKTPYLREIMDKLSATDPCQRVTFMKGAQLGATECGNNWLGYIIDNAPAPTLMVMPTEETVKRNSKFRIDPMIEATPRLTEKVKEARSRDSGNTVFSKEFPGGVLMMAGANSAVGLRSMPVRNLMLDEIDGYPLDLDKEGSPIALAEARTRTFRNRKIFKISTPTYEGASAIAREFAATDQRFYYVPCPLCGVFQPLVWSNVVWEKGKPETAKYKCEICEGLIPERHKARMLSNGYWHATKPENSSHRIAGYHLNSLYSPWYFWHEIVELWEAAQKDTDLMKTFVNTILGEVWKVAGEAPDWAPLYDRREPYNPANVVPNPVGFITCGVDIQKDRIEAEVVGWAQGAESWGLGYFVLSGDTAAPEVWVLLAELLATRFVREDGQEMVITTTCIDTGYNTQQVYKFARNYATSRVVPIKGQEAQAVPISAPRAVQIRMDGKRAGSTRLVSVGVSLLKSELYGWLKLTSLDGGITPPGYCHFPAEYDEHYFKMLTAEKLQYEGNKKGFGKYVWIKRFERNEALDCRVYARAAATIIGIDRFKLPDWEKLQGAGTVATPEPVEPPPGQAIQKPINLSSPPPAQAPPMAAKNKPTPRRDFWSK